jgi:hypothetical protein
MMRKLLHESIEDNKGDIETRVELLGTRTIPLNTNPTTPDTTLSLSTTPIITPLPTTTTSIKRISKQMATPQFLDFQNAIKDASAKTKSLCFVCLFFVHVLSEIKSASF